jgi:hypothetical protein
MGTGKISGGLGATALLLAITSLANADPSPLYQWSLNNPPNTSAPTATTVIPDVTPNGLSTDGGTLTMVGANSGANFTSASFYSANGGGVSGNSGDYAFDNSGAALEGYGATNGLAYSTTANALTALPNLQQVTLTFWVNPTTAELTTQSRIMVLGGSQSFDNTSGIDGINVNLNSGKVQYQLQSQSSGSVSFSGGAVGNTLVANTWNFVAVQVNLNTSNIYYDPAIRSATGGAESDNGATYQYVAMTNTGAYTSTSGITTTGAATGTADGTILFGGESVYAQLMNKYAAGRPFEGLGDDFRIYNGLLTTAQLQDIITADDPSASFATPEPSTLAGLTFVSGITMLRRRRRHVLTAR